MSENNHHAGFAALFRPQSSTRVDEIREKMAADQLRHEKAMADHRAAMAAIDEEREANRKEHADELVSLKIRNALALRDVELEHEREERDAESGAMADILED